MPAVRVSGAAAEPEALCGCRECGLVQRRVALAPRQTARCCRCGAVLYRAPPNSLDRTLASALAAAILFLMANAFPILGLEIQGRHSEATLLGAVLHLRAHGMALMAGLVLFTACIGPALEVLGLVYVLLPLRLNRTLPGQAAVFRLVQQLQPWAMVEVFMLGVLVALVKLTHLANIVPGASLWLFGGFIVAAAAANANLDREDIWSRLVRERPHSRPSERPDRLVACQGCGLLAAAGGPGSHCRRCGGLLHARKPDSLARCGALLSAALILYFPANLLPVMVTSSVLGRQVDTILSGVVYLWVSGSWPLALLVFFASVMVPLLKLIALSLLLLTVRLGSSWRPMDRTRLYRLTESVGRWSMVDIFVVTVLTALVDAGPLAMVEAGPGAVAFGAVVVLTMLAAMSFDPRLIWDPIRDQSRAR